MTRCYYTRSYLIELTCLSETMDDGKIDVDNVLDLVAAVILLSKYQGWDESRTDRICDRVVQFESR